jgi:hypothetical protein
VTSGFVQPDGRNVSVPLLNDPALDRSWSTSRTAVMKRQRSTVLAWGLWLTTFGFLAAGLVVAVAVVRPLTLRVLAAGALGAVTFSLGFATVGLVVGTRRPANPIGWLYAAAGLASSLTVPLDPWVDQLLAEHRPLPLVAQLNAVVGDLNWVTPIALGVTLPALLLPDGHLRSPRWRLVAAASVIGIVMVLVGGSVVPRRLGDLPVDRPFGLGGVGGTVAWVVLYTGVALHWASLLAALVCVVLRFRASRGTQRQQMRWVGAGAAAAVIGLLLSVPGALGLLPNATTFILYPGLLCPPVGVAVAVLRYRLWDLDRLVSRTVTYTLVTALLVAPYLLIVPAATRLAAGSGGLAVAAATLAAAAAFQPLRRRVQDQVDHRFNRRRYDAARTVEAFAAHLRDQVDLDALGAELLAVVERTVQPTKASLWLRPPAAPRPR